jgi:hypothetical protein
VWFGGRQAAQTRSSRALSLTELSGSGGSVSDYTELGLLRSDHHDDLESVQPTAQASAIADVQHRRVEDENSDSDDERSGH